MDPLTISDAASRYLFCQVVSKTDVLAVFETVSGVRLASGGRTDNGAPFATRAIAGLSPLAVYWMKLGIIPERIAAGHPEQNGRHERMHRTLKAETAKPPAANPRAQQKVFDRFRTTYNQERPHEALEMKTACRPSTQSFIPQPGTARTLHVRWKGEKIFPAKPCEPIGLERIDEDLWRIHFAAFPIALFDTLPSYPTLATLKQRK